MLLKVAVSFLEFLHQFRMFFSLLIVISAGYLFSPDTHSLVLAHFVQFGHLTLAVIGQAVDLAAQRLALRMPPNIIKRPCEFC